MLSCVLTCQSCGGRRPSLLAEDVLKKLQAGEPVPIHCPVCRETTEWKFALDDRRGGEDRRKSWDRRAATETFFVRLAEDGSARSAIEKRTSSRYRSLPGAYVAYVEGSGAIRDLSLGGMFVMDTRPVAVGSEITFELRLGGYAIPVKGVVRRSVRGEGLGIEFVEVPAEGKRRLKIYLAALAAPADEEKQKP